MTKIILFDFWGTLVETGVKSPLRQVKDLLQLRLPFSEYVVRAERAMMTGPFPELKDAFTQVCWEFKVEPTPELIEELVGLWNKSWMLASPYPEVLEQLELLKKKYRLILISNTDCFSVPKTMEKYQFSPFFEKVFYSYELGLLKTDPFFFARILTEIQSTSEECVLVGDSIESDIIPAKRNGFKVILIDRHHRRDFTPKIYNLEELEGVLA